MRDACKSRVELGLLVAVLLLAALLRLWALDDVPPGLEHDEVANWLIARDILSGQHAIYFTAAYGHEPLWQYAQAGTVALLGDNWLGARAASVLFGLLSIVSAYLLARRLFGRAVALMAAAWLAVSFWHLFYSRVALRAISLPALSALAAYYVWRVTNSPIYPSTNRGKLVNWGLANRDAVLAGLFTGLSAYTYMAARALPFILGGWLLYLALLHRPKLRRNWRGLGLALLVAAVVAAPLVLWLLMHPGAEYRIGEVSEPLDRLLAGDPGLVADNAVALIKMWSVAGDPWDRQNIPGRPVFVEPLGALLFYAGLLIALWRVRRPAFAFVLIWLAGSLIPSLVTSVAPSSIRAINALGVVYVFPALAVQEAVARLRAPRPKVLVGAVVGLVLVLNLYLTARDYFVRWPDDAGVQFVFQTGLTEIARHLDADPDDSPVAVAGLSVDTMDPPTFAVSLRRRDLALRWFDPREALVIPGGGAPARLYVPKIVPMATPLQGQLAAWGATRRESEHFVRYDLLGGAHIRSRLPTLETSEVSFGGRVALLGYEWVTSPVTPGHTAELLTYWRVVVTPQPPLKIFLHLVPVGGEGALAQNDGLGSPPDTWQPGDVVVRWHRIELPSDLAPGLYQPQVGWYNPETGERLRLEDAGAPFADRLPLTPMEILQ